jgi:uncharacterized protein (UPF0261 family)/ABC-type branched-subunit amino acid transport system ATPase component
MADTSKSKAILQINDLHVYYGESHALQGVSLSLEKGIVSVVGRNGMGKSTLCNTIVGLRRARSGSIRFDGREISSLAPHEINRLGIGYVPQGRRVWPSLTVEQTLLLGMHRAKDAGGWTLERVYQSFPRLAERKNNGGAQLSGGEQQMLAISRALLSNPKLLVMDEPTEGLAPVIVDQVRDLLIRIARDEDVSILVIEQNIGVATSVSDQVAIMVNGRINRVMASQALSADRDLQQRLLGVGRHTDEEVPTPTTEVGDSTRERVAQVYRIERGGSDNQNSNSGGESYVANPTPPNRWGLSLGSPSAPQIVEQTEIENVFAIPLSERFGRTALVVGTYDTKGPELRFIRDKLRALGIPAKTVDLSTSGRPSMADVSPLQIASMHRGGSTAVFGTDRGQSVSTMAEAFARWIERERGIGGVISAGGSGGTSLATAGMRKLPVGIPKVMVSTVASGDVGHYVGPSDIMMMYSVADVQGINPISEQVLSNAAHALAGMIAGMPSTAEREAKRRHAKPAVGLTMFGVTTPCVQALQKKLEADYDCMIFHATGTGGRSMENLVGSGLINAVMDITTTEVADMLVGGVFAADADRFGSIIRTGIPYVGSVGALDMVNFGPRNTVPEKFRSRKFVVHNPNVTLMRTTRDENRAMGQWIAERLNQMDGPVRFLLPEMGVSLIDAPGKPFHDPEADNALFEAIEKTIRPTSRRTVARVKANINDPLFVEAALSAFASITPKIARRA